jgi:hypothetical protein
MAGDKTAGYNLGSIESYAGNVEKAVKHWMIAASVGEYHAMNAPRKCFEKGQVSRESIDSH